MEILASYSTSTMGLLLEGVVCIFLYDQLYRWYCRKKNCKPLAIWRHLVPKAEVVEEETVQQPTRKAA